MVPLMVGNKGHDLWRYGWRFMQRSLFSFQNIQRNIFIAFLFLTQAYFTAEDTLRCKKAPGCHCQIHHCSGFSQDRVNFHQKPRGDTVRWLTQTGQKNGVLNTMCRHSGF